MKMDKLAVLGATGLIGSWVYKTFQDESYDVIGTGFSNVSDDLIKLNIGNFSQLEKFIHIEQPDVLINCVGIVGKNKCNREIEKSKIANLKGVKNISYLCKKNKLGLIHFSTIVVHDGKKPTPYLEKDNPTKRIGDKYNKQKSEAEFFAESVPNSVIIRLGDVYGFNYKNTLQIGGESFKEAYDLLKQGKKFSVFKGIKSNKTLVSNLGGVVLELYEKGYSGRINIGGEEVDNYSFIKKMKKSLNLPGMVASIDAPQNYPLHKLFDLTKMNNEGIKLHSVDEGLKILSKYLR